MKEFLKRVCNYFYFCKNKRLVTTMGNGKVSFFRGTKIVYTWGADKNNIQIDEGARIYGSLTACRNGFIHIGKSVHLGPYSRIQSVNKVYIGDFTTIAPHVTITDNNNHPINPEDRRNMCIAPPGAYEKSWMVSENKSVFIGSTVWIGEGAYIAKGVTIGDNSIIGAHSVVTKDIPPNCIAAGNPAKVVKNNIDKVPSVL